MNETDRTDRLVDDYLRRLEKAAYALPPGRRAELVLEIRDHIVEARASADGATDEAWTRTLLDRLGTPEEIVAAATDGQQPPPQHQSVPPPTATEAAAPPPPVTEAAPPTPPPPPVTQTAPPTAPPPAVQGSHVSTAARWGGLEIAAVALLAVGAFVLPGVGSLIGLLLAWVSSAWTTGEKLLASAVVALGTAVPLLALRAVLSDFRMGAPVMSSFSVSGGLGLYPVVILIAGLTGPLAAGFLAIRLSGRR